MRVVSILCILLLAAGCQRYTAHSWQTEAEFDIEAVEFVRPANLSRVKAELEPEAIRLLENVSFIALTQDEFARLSQNARELVNNETAYLVRAVTWSRPPAFSAVALERARGVLYVLQFSYSGEILVPFKENRSVAYPLIAILDSGIASVRPGAVAGGDAATRWQTVYGDYAWFEQRKR